jgi:hypothetical protein
MTTVIEDRTYLRPPEQIETLAQAIGCWLTVYSGKLSDE